jgi:hypothetical protein
MFWVMFGKGGGQNTVRGFVTEQRYLVLILVLKLSSRAKVSVKGVFFLILSA